MQLSEIKYDVQCYTAAKSQPAKIDLNKKSLHKQNFTIDAQGFKKTRNENPPMREVGGTC